MISSLFFGSYISAADKSIHLYHTPTFNKNEIVFCYAGDLWSVPRQGGSATRLTAGIGIESDPVLSPDGGTLAFTGEYDGNVDVYTMSATGGIPKRVTFHPGADYVVGWSPDGQRILFRSARESFSQFTRLFTVSRNGGLAEALPLPNAFSGSFSPDGGHLAYAPVDALQFGRIPGRWVAWHHYRGGDASYLWIVDLANLNIDRVPRIDSNDVNPMWVGNDLYFLSDRNGPMTLFRYDSASHVVVEVIENKGPDIRSASAGPGGIIYEQFGQIVFYDFKTKGNNAIPITVDADLSEIRPRTQSVGGEAHFGRISPTGVRAVFEAHGDVFTVPAEKGDIRNLTHSPGVMERTPAWSPDGSSIAYLSDDSGEYSLHVLPESGEGSPKRFALGRRSVFYSAPQWSPDSTTIALSNNQLEIILVDVASGTVTMVDTDYFYPYGDFDRDIAWSPDSKWIAYSKILPNHLHAINLYSALTQKSTQVSDGMSDARFPAFDRNGLYLYYAASTDYGPSSYGLDMTSAGHRITRVVYATVLSSRSASPVIPLSDEESPNHGASSAQHSSPALGLLQIDLDDLSSRTVALPISPGDVRGVFAGASGQIYILKNSYPEPTDHNRGNFLLKFDLATRRQEVLAHDVDDLDVSNDGKKMLLSLPGPNGSQNSRRWLIAPTSGTVNVTAGILDLGTMEMRIDPQAEWKQMYREVWRIERAFFYDPNLHGLDSVAMEKMYEPHVESLTSRDDLNYIFQEMLAEVLSSHLRGGGGTIPRAKRVPGGLLGADYRIDHDLYRIQHIYKGQAWDPELRAPLSGPGVDVKEGEYLFEVNGHELSPDDDVNAWLEGTAGKRVVIRVGPEPNEATSREVTVFPVASEVLLRNSDWIESNRRRVDRLSAGRLAYVYMPNTAEEGLSSFNRLFYAQVQKEGLILDERYNSGGQVADYVIGVLNQPLLAWTAFRYGAIQKSPSGSIQGPKVLLINETAGSGGDMLAWMFRYANVGTLVGKRTWGGLTGILAVPQLMDGGYVTAPTMRLFDPEGQWIVENSGVRPDVEVEFDPRSVDRGGDPQIERAVSIALEKLKSNPQGNVSHPTYPNFQSNKPEEKRRENR